MERRRIAVIGSGVAGLTAAYVLGRRDDVTLFEADDRIGGHAHTHDVTSADGRTLAVDSGFIVHNERTYPRLIRLFAELGVRTQPSDMSMSVSCGGCGLEYAGGKGAPGLFARVSSVARAPYLRMLTEVPRFHRMAREALEHGDDRTLGEFVAGFSPYFISHFTTPLVSAVWSCPPSDAGRYPARYLFAFLANHGMLTVSGSPRWRTVTGGSRDYVEKIAKTLTAVHTSTPVRALRRTGEGVEFQADGVQRFDAAVVATHPDQALRLLAEPTPGEREVLGAFRYSRNPVTLHTDPSVLPRARRARASWNYRMESCTADAAGARVTYDMNRLQRLETSRPHLVTLGAEIPDGHAIARMTYEHPVYTPESVAAQERLPALDDDVIAYAGAYHGWGFHEDGCGSGVRAAEALGGRW
ncbi:Predicted NAD/FAD-binding protein [Streptosporangium subroseum]|uniref:Predicted NAD/FAD-binding protein n=1 Tax=Streptosporangium subroseum TaxID=106412 RepID=A0A239BUN4_9ACTN|nr:FAD-dependent oxidoreductase [Streptosporangium subroseum]SNS11128.1 Predicted NAD/FAD-binding protein [Streptosporangium subroseum]